MATVTPLSSADLTAASWAALAGVLGLPLTAREYLADKAAPVQVLLVGLSPDEIRASRAMSRSEPEVPGVERFPQVVVGDRATSPGTALLIGRREQVERWGRELGGDLGRDVVRAVGNGLLPPRFAVGARRQESATWIMGVLNVTPDSFSDGGQFIEASRAVERGLQMAAQGADIIDVGGESTRPGGGIYGAGMVEVPADVEEERVVPVVRELARQTRSAISIDTRKASVARAALAAGAQMINDVSGFTHDPQMLQVAVEAGASVCAMHLPGDLRTLQQAPSYPDLLGEVARFLSAAAAKARASGVPAERICVDPGIGFGKTVRHNLELLRHAGALSVLGYPVLVGASRKSFIGAVCERPNPQDRLLGSVAAAVVAVRSGASLVRAHDVAETRDALRLVDAVREAESSANSDR